MLEKGLSLIEDENDWSSEGWGTDGTRCALHAIWGFRSHDSYLKAFMLLDGMTQAMNGDQLFEFNNSHTHAEVIALFQKAIRVEKEKAGVLVEIPEGVPERELENG